VAADQGSVVTGRRRRTAPEVAASWGSVAAVLLGLAGVADLVRWGNRWYITEVFARNAGVPGGASWEYAYGLLHGAHEALVRGLVLLLIAAAVATITAVIRHRVGR